MLLAGLRAKAEGQGRLPGVDDIQEYLKSIIREGAEGDRPGGAKVGGQYSNRLMGELSYVSFTEDEGTFYSNTWHE